MEEILGQKGIIEKTFLSDAKEQAANRYIIIKPPTKSEKSTKL